MLIQLTGVILEKGIVPSLAIGPDSGVSETRILSNLIQMIGSDENGVI